MRKSETWQEMVTPIPLMFAAVSSPLDTSSMVVRLFWFCKFFSCSLESFTMAYYLTCYRFTRPFLKNYISTLSALHSDKYVSTSSHRQSETFFEKNERLKRPMSPHLTIYKPQLTSILSLTHRTTGIVLSGALYTLSIGMLVLPANFPYYISYLQSLHLPSALILSFKFALAWTFMYHTANGIRHLAWDMGYGYEMKNLYMSGYLVVGTSVIASLLAASM